MAGITTKANSPLDASLKKFADEIAKKAQGMASSPALGGGLEKKLDKFGDKFKFNVPNLKTNHEFDTTKHDKGSSVNALTALTSLKGGLTAAYGAVTGFADALKPFVEAFSPAAVLQFNQALYDLNAVIGRVLEPVLQGLTMVVREVGALLLPIAEKLTPVFQDLASVTVQVLIPILDLFAMQINAIVPFLKLFTEVLVALTPLFRGLMAIVQALYDAFLNTYKSLGEFLGNKNAMNVFKDAVLNATKGLLLFTAHMLKFFGATGVLDGLKKALSGGVSDKKDATGQGAAKNATFTNFADYGRQIALQASTAQGGQNEPKKQEDLFADVVAKIQEIQDGNAMSTQEIVDKIGEAGIQIARDIVAALKGDTLDATRQAAQSVADRGGSVAGIATLGSFLGPIGTLGGQALRFANRGR